MALHEMPFIQAIEVDSTEIDIARLIEAAYIETLDLSGPKLILRLNDQDSAIRDDAGLTEDAKLNVRIGTPNGNESHIDYSFTVISYSADGDLLTVNGLLTAVYKLKKHPDGPVFFVESSASAILSSLVDLKMDFDRVDQVLTHHLTPTITPAQMIRQMAQENSLQIFVSRGVLTTRKNANLLKGAHSFEYEYLSSGGDYQVRGYRLIGQRERYNRVLTRNALGWSMLEGVVSSNSNGSFLMTSLESPAQLTGLASYVVPIMEFDTLGNDSLTAGMQLKFTMNRFRVDSVVDESIPEYMVITRVTHLQRAMKYICLVEVGLPNDAI